MTVVLVLLALGAAFLAGWLARAAVSRAGRETAGRPELYDWATDDEDLAGGSER